MKLTDLVKKRELPFYNKDDNNKPVRTKNENKSAWRFRRKDVYDWLVKNNFTDYKMEGDELPPPVGLLCSPHWVFKYHSRVVFIYGDRKRTICAHPMLKRVQKEVRELKKKSAKKHKK